MISAGIDNEIKIWDLRKNAVVTEIGQEEEEVSVMEIGEDSSSLIT